MWVFLGFPVGGLEGWNGGPQTSPMHGPLQTPYWGRLGGGQAFGPPFHPVDFPKGNPEEYPYFPSIG